MIRGNPNSPILILGEAPGENEMKARMPFVGSSGAELGKMLREAGISESDCLFANVCNERPPKNDISVWFPSSKKQAAIDGATWHWGKWTCTPILQGLDRLAETIRAMPNLQLIIAVGNVPLWATTHEWGITKWRGSQMHRNLYGRDIAIVPTYHPAAVQRMWEWRWISVLDYKRAKQWLDEGLKVPDHEYIIRPSFASCCDYLQRVLSRLELEQLPLSVDIETRSRHIACIGLADSPTRAICIPFMTTTGPYFSESEEIHIKWLLYQVLTHTNVEVIGQNFSYDRQYIARRWGFRSDLSHDTMVKHHLAFPGVPKGLDFICSIFNRFYCYWKDESKDWDPAIGEEQLWIYNCKDAVGTFEANGHLDTALKAFNLTEQLSFQMKTGEIAFDMMLRGIRVNLDYKMQLHETLVKMLGERESFIHKVTGIPLNPTSPKQVHSFVYGVLKLPPIYKIVKGQAPRLTADKEAIEEWLDTCDPLFRPVLQAIMDYRSLNVYNSTFALAKLDTDGRFRCSINIALVETFRWSTSEDAFGYGTNMQNIPRPDDD